MFRKWANQVLKEYLLTGYVINENRVIVSNENYIELRNEVSSINNRLLKLEDKVFDKEYGLNKLFFDGQFYDAYTLIQSLFESVVTNTIYYGICFILYITNIFQPTLLGIALMFGIGNVFNKFFCKVNFLFYFIWRWYFVKCNKK